MTVIPVLLPALFCALLFGMSGLGKLGRQTYYIALIGAWLPLQPLAARGLVLALGLAELAVALALCLDATRRFAAAAAVVLLLGYLAALAWQLRRGRTDLDCGCGGLAGRQKIHGRLLLRNLALAAVAAMPLSGQEPAQITPAELALALAAAVLFHFLYAGLEALPARAAGGGRLLHAGRQR